MHASILWNYLANEKSPAAFLPAEARTLLAHAVMNACDGLDGVTDGILNDPRQCHFDPASLVCSGPSQQNCLTLTQLATVKALYAGPSNPRTGESLYPGVPAGSEFAWDGIDPVPGGPATFPAHFSMGVWGRV